MTAVARRQQDGWTAMGRADGSVAWRATGFYPPKWEDMTDAERRALQVLSEGESDV